LLASASHGLTEQELYELVKDNLASGSWDKTVRIWDIESGKEISSLSENTVVNSVNWSPLGNILVIGRRDNAIRTWDATNDRQTLLLREEDPIDRNKLIQASLPLQNYCYESVSSCRPKFSCQKNKKLTHCTTKVQKEKKFMETIPNEKFLGVHI
jgi:WD40 repeat protein